MIVVIVIVMFAATRATEVRSSEYYDMLLSGEIEDGDNLTADVADGAISITRDGL